MFWKIFLLSLSIIALTNANEIMNKDLVLQSVMTFPNKSSIIEFLSDFVNNSMKIEENIPSEFLNQRLYENKSGNFVNNSIEKLDQDMKNHLTNLSVMIDKMAADEDEKFENFYNQPNKNFNSSSDKYSPFFLPIVELYEKSKSLQNETFNQEDNLKNFTFTVYNQILDYLGEHLNEMITQTKNPKEFVEEYLDDMAEENSNNFVDLNCREKIHIAKLEVRNVFGIINVMELRAIHVEIHAAWIELLFGDDKHFKKLELTLKNAEKRIEKYYEIQHEILDELQKNKENCSTIENTTTPNTTMKNGPTDNP